MTEKHQEQEFVEQIAKALVNHPNDVKVERKVDEMGILLTLKTNPADIGQVIGRQGDIANSIRTLLRIIGRKNNAKINLKIGEDIEPKNSNQEFQA